MQNEYSMFAPDGFLAIEVAGRPYMIVRLPASYCWPVFPRSEVDRFRHCSIAALASWARETWPVCHIEVTVSEIAACDVYAARSALGEVEQTVAEQEFEAARLRLLQQVIAKLGTSPDGKIQSEIQTGAPHPIPTPTNQHNLHSAPARPVSVR